MKHRTHPKFPKYRIYADGTIIQQTYWAYSKA